ncbi:MAG: hypothetical protein JO147_02740 [Actinobacteria bacterium]|nr:hypothetical protein [Actinomycetota bacterium]
MADMDSDATSRSSDSDADPRIRRRRRPRRAGGDERRGSTEPSDEQRLEPAEISGPARRGRGRPAGRDAGMRDLIGAGSSQLGPGGALRGRDVNRPSPEDLEAAERDVQIVRRHWRPDS